MQKMIHEFIKTLLSLSVSGTLLMLLIRGLKPLYKNRFSQHWQYYIWLLVVLRFLLPVTPDVTIVGSLFQKLNEPSIELNIVNTTTLYYNMQIEPQEKTSPAASMAWHCSPDRYTCLFYAWLTLTIILWVRRITVYQSFTQWLKAGNKEVSNMKTLNLLSDCKESLRIKARIRLYRNAMITSPIMTGIFHPGIILPVKELGRKELSYIFTHELIHYKKKDLFYKWLIQAVTCIHWFNPFVYLLGKEVNRTCELSCDEAVVSMLDNQAKREYGDLLISFVRADSPYQNPMSSVPLTEGAEQLIERLGAIMKSQKKTKSIKVITALFTCILCICFAAAGAYAAPGRTEETIMQELEQGEQSMEEQELSVSYDKDYESVYTQEGYFYNSYIIEIGWNVNGDRYSNQAELALNNGSAMKVYFADTAMNMITDQNTATAIAGLLSHLKNLNSYPTIEAPLITKIIDTRDKNLPALREDLYQAGDVCGFSALFSLLDEAEQKEWYQKLYDAGQTAFFASVIKYMNLDLLSVYADQIDQDAKTSFLSVILNYLQPDTIKQYAKQYYAADDIARFTVIFPYLSEEEQQDWLKKAQADQNNKFIMALSGYLS